MSLMKLPEIRADHRLGAAQFDVRPEALDRWHPEVRAAAGDSEEATISIYDSIGESYDGQGITAKKVAAILRNIGDRDVVVNINSPGGNFFEGVAIYNLFRNHKAKVTTRVIGLAASAASVIAMAGDEILMADGSFLMVHNAWAVAVGNRHDMADAAAHLAPFDTAMAEVYASRSGLTVAAAAKLMDNETWIGAAQAVEDGFATGLLERAEVTQDPKAQGSRKALALVEASMTRAGHSRATRRDALKALFSGTPSAAGDDAMPCAGDSAALLLSLTKALKV